ncbi:ankyrin repeat domain-containing protein [Acerihabitans sp. TG2]|uniref:ankyrin repeat domain-containing protein n=1 Tax=Acerihabitans sp. TG2 TaxID=3096008 RepID=UPI002B232F6D|nr:ankyrin repeat domain-containing protein [Acerihabitans sp. TG2]MEA9392367.1 ankyrin repeat domain-containing protein [Acerihabitans sp. TG2]
MTNLVQTHLSLGSVNCPLHVTKINYSVIKSVHNQYYMNSIMKNVPKRIMREINLNVQHIKNKEPRINDDLVYSWYAKNLDKQSQSTRSVTRNNQHILLNINNVIEPDPELLSNLRNKGVDANVQDKYGFTVIMLLIKKNKNDDFFNQILAKYKPNVNLRNYNGDTALHFAVRMKDHNKVAMLIKYGADACLPNNNCETPLMLAGRMNNDMLIEKVSVRSTIKDIKIPLDLPMSGRSHDSNPVVVANGARNNAQRQENTPVENG